jgi:hypothetical protein
MTPSSSALTSNKSVAELVERVAEQLRLLIPKSESGQGAVSGPWRIISAGESTTFESHGDTSGTFTYVRLSSVYLASFLKLREIGTTESK